MREEKGEKVSSSFSMSWEDLQRLLIQHDFLADSAEVKAITLTKPKTLKIDFEF